MKRIHLNKPIPLNNMFEILRGLDESGDSLDISEYNLSRDDDDIFQERVPQQTETHEEKDTSTNTINVPFIEEDNHILLFLFSGFNDRHY